MRWREFGGVERREILRLACIVSVTTIIATITYPSLRPEQPVSRAVQLDEFVGKERAALNAFKDEQRELIYSWLEDYPSKQDLARLEDHPSDQPKHDLSYLADYAYSEVPPPQKPAETVLASLKDIPVGTPIEEIKRASDAFGLDFTFMKTVARIESGFDPKQRTGSYIGLFQLSNYEFAKYGSGSITNARDNAIAAAYKFTTEGILFELDTHKRPTRYDRYLIHQQGTQGAAEHVAHPDWVAWKSMCATEEGKEKGEAWCKRAIWKNTLPVVKEIWKTVERLTSAGFVNMWEHQLDQLYARYSAPGAPLPAVAVTIPSLAPPTQIKVAASAAAKKRASKHAVHVAALAHHHKPAAHASSKTSRSRKTATKTLGKPAARG
jgi:hypothetical protein